jgi:hypothetical protein
VKRILAAALAAALLGAAGLKRGTDEAFTVALYKRRPHLLRYGPKATLGHCIVRETDDPSSDVLSNLIDTDADGHSDLRLTAFIDASAPICERRWGLLWLNTDVARCHAASLGCTDERPN